MSRVLTNNSTLRYAIESSIGTLPGSPAWRLLEPNNITAYGAKLTTVVRRPISPTRGRRKGTVTNLESEVGFEADLTMDAATDFVEGFIFAEFMNVDFDLKSSTGTLPPPVASGTTYTIDAASAALAAKIQFVSTDYATLVYAKGYTNSANNGLKPITADTAGGGTVITVANTLVAETPPTNASLQIAGVRILDASDLTLTISGSTATLVSAADITNWGTLGIKKGMWIHIGSNNGTTGAVTNALGASNVSYGYARVTATPTGATLALDKLDTKLVTATTNAGSCDILFGRMARNVATDHDSTDDRYLERTYQFEVAYPDLGGVGTDNYEYAIGNFADEWVINLGLAAKATCTWKFIGTNVDDITASRKTNASAAVTPLRTTAVNTTSDLAVISTDVVSSVSDVCFKSLTITLKDNVSPEQCLGTLGATFVNAGLFEVNLAGNMLFTNKAIVNAVKNNTTVTFHTVVKNDDGAMVLDIPSLTLGDGGREFPVDESVQVKLTGASFTDSTYGFDVGINFLVGTPTLRT